MRSDRRPDGEQRREHVTPEVRRRNVRDVRQHGSGRALVHASVHQRRRDGDPTLDKFADAVALDDHPAARDAAVAVHARIEQRHGSHRAAAAVMVYQRTQVELIHIVAIDDEHRAGSAAPFVRQLAECAGRAEQLGLFAVTHAHTEPRAVADRVDDVVGTVMQVDPHRGDAGVCQPPQVAFEHHLTADVDQQLDRPSSSPAIARAAACREHERLHCDRRAHRGSIFNS